jgi:hypothetical protein
MRVRRERFGSHRSVGVRSTIGTKLAWSLTRTSNCRFAKRAGRCPLNAAATKRLNVVLERLRAERKQSVVKRFIEIVGREYPTVPRAAWEQAFGLSPGYLSRLASGHRLADTPLEILLAGFAKNPSNVLDLIEATGHMPKLLMAHLARTKSPRSKVRPA